MNFLEKRKLRKKMVLKEITEEPFIITNYKDLLSIQGFLFEKIVDYIHIEVQTQSVKNFFLTALSGFAMTVTLKERKPKIRLFQKKRFLKMIADGKCPVCKKDLNNEDCPYCFYKILHTEQLIIGLLDSNKSLVIEFDSRVLNTRSLKDSGIQKEEILKAFQDTINSHYNIIINIESLYTELSMFEQMVIPLFLYEHHLFVNIKKENRCPECGSWNFYNAEYCTSCGVKGVFR